MITFLVSDVAGVERAWDRVAALHILQRATLEEHQHDANERKRHSSFGQTDEGRWGRGRDAYKTSKTCLKHVL